MFRTIALKPERSPANSLADSDSETLCPASSRKACITGVDSSTQFTKVEVRDLETGRLVASGSVPHPAVTPPCAEQDPAAWEEAFAAAWKAAGAPHVEAITLVDRGVTSLAYQRILADLSGRPGSRLPDPTIRRPASSS